MRKALNSLYRASTILAACCLAAIALLVALQVGGRIFDYARTLTGLEPVGLQIPSLSDFAGFLLVGASFLALAGTFRNSDHIRVTILLQAVPQRFARFLNIWSTSVALVLAAFFTWNAALLVIDSYIFWETSPGLVPIPLVIPQSAMTLGLGVFALALFDDLILILTGQAPSFETAAKADLIEGKE